jgi:hypothetical protein
MRLQRDVRGVVQASDLARGGGSRELMTMEAAKPAVDGIIACPSAMVQRCASRKRERN